MHSIKVRCDKIEISIEDELLIVEGKRLEFICQIFFYRVFILLITPYIFAGNWLKEISANQFMQMW